MNRIPPELARWPVNQLSTVLGDMKYRYLPTHEIVLMYRRHEYELLMELWRHEYVGLREGLVLGKVDKCTLDALQLTPAGEGLYEVVSDLHRKARPTLAHLIGASARN
jgi:hypothetical protein